MNESPSTDEQPVDPPPASPRGLVIVAGYGPVGRVVCDMLENAGFEIHVIDINKRTTEKEHPHKRKFILGDIRDPTVLIKAGIRQATALILGIPDEDQAVVACRVARELSPDIYIAARTNFVSKGLLATQAGADHVVIEEVVTAQAMKEAIMHLVEEKQAE